MRITDHKKSPESSQGLRSDRLELPPRFRSYSHRRVSGNLETNTNGKLKGLSKVLNLRSELHPPLGLEQSQAPYFQGMGNLGSVYCMLNANESKSIETWRDWG